MRRASALVLLLAGCAASEPRETACERQAENSPAPS